MSNGGGAAGGQLRRATDRGMSPVLGVTLLIGIVLLLSAVTAMLFLDAGRKPDPAPEVVLDLREGKFPPVHYLYHRGGDDLGGTEKTKIRGIANPDVLHDEELTAGEDRAVIPVVPVDRKVQVIWYGSDGTSYVLWEFEPSSYLSATPDEGCGWVDAETNNGTSPITIDGIVVTCDVITQGDIDVVNDAIVVGNVTSTANNVDLDEVTVYGPVGADGDVDLDGTNVSGSVESTGQDVVLTDGSNVDGDVRIGSGGNVDVDGGSTVDGDVVAGNDVSIASASVGGDVVSYNGTVDVADTTISGDVYVESGGFSCSNATINGQDCGSYTPKDPDDY